MHIISSLLDASARRSWQNRQSQDPTSHLGSWPRETFLLALFYGALKPKESQDLNVRTFCCGASMQGF
jgi:hypothetical protein